MSHKEKVARIIEQLKNNTKHRSVSFIKRTVSHQVPKQDFLEDKTIKINFSDLNEIIKIDTKNNTCTVEPGVTFSDLVKATIKHNLVPLVVPELKDITVGGAVAGCSIESMSYKIGGFHDNCIEYEIITSDGRVITATPENENRDIFQMVHGTFGTIGFISKLKFKLIPCKPFVHLKYKTFNSLESYSAAIVKFYETKKVDFIDGIIFSPKKFVLCLGDFTDNTPYSNSYYWNKVYWKSSCKLKEDYLKTYDYFFRYDAGCHWVGRNYGLENPVLRFVFGKFFLPSTKMLCFGKKINSILIDKKPDVVVDIFTPVSKWKKFWDFYLKKFNYFPLWVVPYRIEKPYPWINSNHIKNIKDKLYIDLAVYGMKEKPNENHYRIMEEELLKLPGIKTLISYNSFSKKEFWKIWNYKNWIAAKSKTDPLGVFGDLYKKTHYK